MLTLQWLSSHSATQPLRVAEWLSGWVAASAALPEWLWLSGRVAAAEWLDQPLSHSARVARPATQPLSHSATLPERLEWLRQPLCQSGWVAEWLVQPLWQSGWVAASISRAVLHIHSNIDNIIYWLHLTTLESCVDHETIFSIENLPARDPALGALHAGTGASWPAILQVSRNVTEISATKFWRSTPWPNGKLCDLWPQKEWLRRPVWFLGSLKPEVH